MLFAADRPFAIGLADGESKAGAGRRQRLETQMLQQPGAAGIPGIGDDEGTGLLMERGECISLFLLRDHGSPLKRA